MQIAVRKNQDVAIVDLSGKLIAGTGDAQLREAINELLADDCRKILLNLSGVTTIDSSGVGELVASLKVSEELGAGLRILRQLDEESRAERVLRMTHILPLFKVYDSEDAAIASFQ